MSTIQLPGLLSGIDTNSLISQLMAVESRTLNMYEERKSLWEERKDALSTLETKLSTLRSSVRALSDSDKLRAFKITSSDSDILTAEASYNAFEGNHTVIINQLASAERWVHTSGIEYAEDYVSPGTAGTFIYSYNHKETTITTTAETTLEDLVGLINNDANNPGVTAGLLFYNNAYHLVLNGNDAGTDYEISINPKNTEVWQADSAFTISSDNATLSTKITELDQFTGALGTGDKITISGKDHSGADIVPDTELTITENTKLAHLISEINDHFDGIATATFKNGKIILTDDTCGESGLEISLSFTRGTGSTASLTLPTMAVSTQGGSTTANLTGFALADFTETQSAQDSQIKVDGYPPGATSEVQTLTVAGTASEGAYTLKYGGEETGTIAYDADAATIQAALEALSTVNEGDITVSGPLNSNPIFTFASSLGDVGLLEINYSGLVGVTDATFAETVKGKLDEWITRSSNTIDDVIYGVTLHLHDTTDAGGEQITLTRDIQLVKDKLNAMVTAYNAAVVYIQEKTGYNDVLKTAGVLMGDYVVSTIRNQLRTPLIAQTSGFIEDIDSFLMPGQIGLELGSDGMLTLDANAFDEAIAQDYLGVLAVIGADKTGSSTSNIIEFYGANSDYTTAGSYRVKVTYAGGNIDKVWIKLSTEDDSQYREATISGNIATGNSTFDDNGDPVYPENSLQLTVPTTGSATIYATVRVKQGFTGVIGDALDRMLKTTTGSIQIDQEHVGDIIKQIQDKVEIEEERLTKKQERLVGRFARLEKTLALLQFQMAALGFSSSTT
jgi:flagellar capping protein FliD